MVSTRALASYLRFVPEWASVLAGVGGGIVATFVGVYYGEWLRHRWARKTRGAELVAQVWGLLDDANPAAFSLVSMQERNQRHGRELWARWYHQFRQSFNVFGQLGSDDVRAAQKQAAADVSFAIHALRQAVDAAGSTEGADRRTAEQFHERARESLARLEERL